jgi:hypothetical protein
MTALRVLLTKGGVIMVQSGKQRLTFVEKWNFTIVIAIILSLAAITAVYYYFPTDGKTYADFSGEYKHVAIAISQDSKEGKFSATLGGRGTYTITRNAEINQEDTYYYSTDYEKKIVTVNDCFSLLSYEYLEKVGEGILKGYERFRLADAAFTAAKLTIIEFLVGIAALEIATFARWLKRRKSNLNPDMTQT